ncbi:SDR family oxidoreductase [Gracilibacillus sp. S3-1-1]|uniref:SDR family oxidoreductase n=1 Tax=Gracilibacillus pellucidus TaxID=3095368 RepID=A0ACC6M518_9BACI|nr:SDR family oxidoreductase [Gracilibacillus sp. S3-1-1]MDX8046059.1 SDR family oxidoreductase [Gracilibacillus sp. S3-1-1]
MNKLNGRHVLITGASSGIGRALAFSLAKQGAIPILVARTESKLMELKTEIENRYAVHPIVYAVDITDYPKWQQTIERIIDEAGKIDILINNAGIGYFDMFEQANWQTIENMVNLNLNAMFLTTSRLLPTLLTQQQAHIINIGSQAGKMATPKSAVYSATKAGVISYSNALRMELQGRVFVTSVNIGPVKTAFFETADPEGTYQKSVERYMLEPMNVANKVTKVIFTNKREINLPYWMHVGSKIYQSFPRTMEKLLGPAFKKK